MIPRPPKQCRVAISGLCYIDGTSVNENHLLTWRGDIQRRTDPEKPDLWKLYSSDDLWVWVEEDYLEILGRTPGSHTVKEQIENGEPFGQIIWPIDPDTEGFPSKP